MTSRGVIVRTTAGLLQIEPEELQFQSIPSEQNSVSMKLINRSDKYVAFMVKQSTSNQKEYLGHPMTGIVLPHATVNVTVKMQVRKDTPPDMHPKDILVIRCVVVNKGTSVNDIPANLFKKMEGHNDGESRSFVIWCHDAPQQPHSPVREGYEKALSPRASRSPSSSEDTLTPLPFNDALKKAFESLNSLAIENKKKKASMVPSEKIFQVEDKSPEAVIHAIRRMIKNRRFCHPNRSIVHYDEKLDRIVLHYEPMITVRRPKFMKLLMMMKQILKHLELASHDNVRSIFYSNEGPDDTIRGYISDICCILKCTCRSLNIIAAKQGRVAGRLIYKVDGRIINCTKGIEGQEITYLVEDIEFISSNAKFVLLVEKESVFYRLVEDRVYDKLHCIIVACGGEACVLTKLFLSKLSREYNLTVLALVDCNAYGLRIIMSLLFGSASMAFDSQNLITSGIYWLGVRPSELTHVPDLLDNLDASFIKKLSTAETELITSLMNSAALRSRPNWVDELRALLAQGFSFNLEGLIYKDTKYISDKYLPYKVSRQDWN